MNQYIKVADGSAVRVDAIVEIRINQVVESFPVEADRGKWYVSAVNAEGTSRQLSDGVFDTKAEAQDWLDELVTQLNYDSDVGFGGV